LENLKCRAPHDISGQNINKNLPKGENADVIIKLMRDSREILSNHEIKPGAPGFKRKPANMIWLWGQGRKPNMPKFIDKFGLSGSVISAVDLIKGLGRILGLNVIDVPGATGYYDTDYEGKAKAGIKSLDKMISFLYMWKLLMKPGITETCGRNLQQLSVLTSWWWAPSWSIVKIGGFPYFGVTGSCHPAFFKNTHL